MPGSGVTRSRLRFVLGAAALGAAAVLAASCVTALDADGYQDSLAATCALMDRCYSVSDEDCTRRIESYVLGSSNRWLYLLAEHNCLNGCSFLPVCLDAAELCVEPLSEVVNGGSDLDEAYCQFDEECCGYHTGKTACVNHICCSPTAVHCEDDLECCPGAGSCDETTNTCGGVYCAEAGVACVNAFQCCTGICDKGKCGAKACAKEGHPCISNDECCDDGVCDPGALKCVQRCTKQGQKCTSDGECCDPESLACKPVDDSGGDTFCLPKSCSPNSSDCLSSDQCCSGFCVPDPYRLCGECVKKGAACGPALPCCDGLACTNGASATCVTCSSTGQSCDPDNPCCPGLTCDEMTCKVKAP